MGTPRVLKPGQRGTLELQARYGPSLLCFRNRYDDATRERPKTVELLVQRRPAKHESERTGPRPTRRQAAGSAAREVALRIGWRARELQSPVRRAGGRWGRRRRVWILHRKMAERLDLLHRVVGGGGYIWKPGVQM
ncbi:MAG: hypothetical protein GY953_25630 [bacterium]|nr:hypothetical protein [bacterium]